MVLLSGIRVNEGKLPLNARKICCKSLKNPQKSYSGLFFNEADGINYIIRVKTLCCSAFSSISRRGGKTLCNFSFQIEEIYLF